MKNDLVPGGSAFAPAARPHFDVTREFSAATHEFVAAETRFVAAEFIRVASEHLFVASATVDSDATNWIAAATKM